MKKILAIIIGCVILSSCKKDKVNIQNPNLFLSKYITTYTNSSIKNKIVEIKYNSEFLPISYNEFINFTNSTISSLTNFTYKNRKLIEINSIQGNTNYKTTLNWKSANLIEYIWSFEGINGGDKGSRKGTLILKDGLLTNFSDEDYTQNNISIKYDQNSNIKEISDYKNQTIYTFSNFDNKINPFNANLPIWIICTQFTGIGNLTFGDLGKNNATDIIFRKNLPRKVLDLKYDENNLLVSCEKEITVISGETPLINSIKYEYLK